MLITVILVILTEVTAGMLYLWLTFDNIGIVIYQ